MSSDRLCDLQPAPQDREYGLERVRKMGRKAPAKLTLRAIKDIYSSWQLWAFILPYLMVAEAGSGTSYFNLYLKAEGYSVVQTNVLPTIGKPDAFADYGEIQALTLYFHTKAMQSRLLQPLPWAGCRMQRAVVSGQLCLCKY